MKGKHDREWIPFGYQLSAISFRLSARFVFGVLASCLIAAFVLLTADS
jgi:hypothetical protein